MPDKDGYPTKKELDYIKNYDLLKIQSFKPLIIFLRSIWWQANWGFKFNKYDLELHTGGWSGNEEIISVLQNTIFWFLCWEKSIRGGHYYFKIYKEDYEK